MLYVYYVLVYTHVSMKYIYIYKILFINKSNVIEIISLRNREKNKSYHDADVNL